MDEIELKITHLSYQDIKERLERMEALKIFDRQLVRDYFFARFENGKQKSNVRLRSIGKNGRLTLKTKQKDDNFKIYRELEVGVSHPNVMRRILKLMGYTLTGYREKWREEFRWNKVLAEIDTYPGMDPYLEIESDNKSHLLDFLKVFGVSLDETSKLTSKELIESRGLSSNMLRFEQDNHLHNRTKQKKNHKLGNR